MTPYEKQAAVYDRMGHDRFSSMMVDYTLKTLKRFGVQPIDGLDLCCGTGTAVKQLSEHGLSMSGLDRSRQMLAVARKKLRRCPVKLYRQELPRFEIKSASGPRGRLHRFDLITCFFDSLNYLTTERQLKAAYRSVYRHLKPGGWFVFDMNTAYMLRTVFTERRPFAGVQNDLAWIFRNRPDTKTNSAELMLTFFVKEGRHWRRFDETHYERAYSNTMIKTMLKQVGFQVKGFYGCFTFDKPVRTTNKIAVAARRPA